MANKAQVIPEPTPWELQIREYWVNSVSNMLNARNGTDSDALAEVAAFRKSWDGGTTSQGRRHNPIWPEFAALSASGIDPLRLIDLFLESWPGVRPPEPRGALSQANFAKYYNSPSSEEVLAAALRVQSDYANTQFSALTRNPAYQSQTQIYRELVADRRSVLTILFRYCLAVQTGINDLAEKLLPAAVTEYLLKRDLYDRLWGSKIPQKLREATMEQLYAYRNHKGNK